MIMNSLQRPSRDGTKTNAMSPKEKSRFAALASIRDIPPRIERRDTELKSLLKRNSNTVNERRDFVTGDDQESERP